LRLACQKTIGAGVQVDFPVHDALLCEADESDAEDAVVTIERLMVEAGAAALDGFHLRVESKIVHHPDHYHDDRGEFMEKKIAEILDCIDPPGGEGR
jgi:hypothetical protein